MVRGELDESIVQYVKIQYYLLIGVRTEDAVKLTVGSASPVIDVGQMDVKGRDLVTGLPKTIRVTSEEIRGAVAEPVNNIMEAIKYTLEKTPPELAADIMEGLVLTGGGRFLRVSTKGKGRNRHARKYCGKPS